MRRDTCGFWSWLLLKQSTEGQTSAFEVRDHRMRLRPLQFAVWVEAVFVHDEIAVADLNAPAGFRAGKPDLDLVVDALVGRRYEASRVLRIDRAQLTIEP
jgi:hypothetical protein